MIGLGRRRDYPAPPPALVERDRRFDRVAAAVLVGVAAVLAGVAVAIWVPDQRVARGPRVRAEVVEVLSVRQPDGPRGVSPDTSSVRVRYTTRDGREVETTVRTTEREFGRTIPLTYDPDDPDRARTVRGPENAWRVPAVPASIALVLGVGFAWQAFRLGRGHLSRSYRKHAWALRNSGRRREYYPAEAPERP